MSKVGVTFKEDPSAGKSNHSSSQQSAGKFDNWEVGTRYQLSELLGKGSYGQVVKAIDRVDGKQVAIKQMKRIFDEPIDAKRAYREMHILRHLRHPSIVSLFDVVSSTVNSNFERYTTANELAQSTSVPRSLGNLYLVFEFVDTDLGKIIKSNQYLSGEHIQYIIYQILDGLKFIHATNVIHRDLKPANILVCCSDCSIKIADFGLSRVIGGEVPIVADKKLDPFVRAVTVAKDGEAEEDQDMRDSPVLAYVEEEPEKALAPGVAPDSDKIAITNPQSFMTAMAPPPPLALKRGLTKHVVTRWYRAPEVILSQSYAAAVDMWSVGCIFAELLSLMKENCANYRMRRALFPGESCGELSAEDLSPRTKDAALQSTHTDLEDELMEDTYGTRSQLSVIFDVMGTPREEELSFLDDKTKSLLRHFRNKPAKHFKSMYPAADDRALELLRSMLSFNPNTRETAATGINHPYFKNMKRHSYMEHYSTPESNQHSVQNGACSPDESSFSASPLNVEVEKTCESEINLKFNIIQEILSYRRADQAKEHLKTGSRMKAANGR